VEEWGQGEVFEEEVEVVMGKGCWKEAQVVFGKAEVEEQLGPQVLAGPLGRWGSWVMEISSGGRKGDARCASIS